jgi:hypothetical protein
MCRLSHKREAGFFQMSQDDEVGDDPLLDDFKLLRRRVFQWQGRGRVLALSGKCSRGQEIEGFGNKHIV